jgi:hypothetical protein
MADAVKRLITSGADGIYLIDGVELFGFKDHDGLSRDGLHLSDHGNWLVAQRLINIIRVKLNPKNP